MKTNRLPPQPMDTALARLVRRIVDCLPGASIGAHRRLINELRISDNTTRRLQQQAYLDQDHITSLYRDIQKLAHKVPPPTIYRVKVTDFSDEVALDEFRKVNVTYVDQSYCYARPYLGRRMVNPHELSEWGRRALEHSAREIAMETAKTHAKYIVDATLNQGIFKP